MNDGIGLGSTSKRILCLLLALSMAVLVAPAVSQAIGITENTMTQPKKLSVGKSKTFKADLHYDNTVGNVPLPSEIGLTIEIPKTVCYQPTVTGYSDNPSMHEMTASNSQAGCPVWQYRSQKWIFSPSDMYIELSVKGKKAGEKKTYMGTRPFTSSTDAAEKNSTKSLTVS